MRALQTCTDVGAQMFYYITWAALCVIRNITFVESWACGVTVCGYFHSQGFMLLSVSWKRKCKSVSQLCPALCDPMDCSPPDSSIHGILQTRILEGVAIPFSRGSSWSRDWTWSPALQADSLLTELPGKLLFPGKYLPKGTNRKEPRLYAILWVPGSRHAWISKLCQTVNSP